MSEIRLFFAGNSDTMCAMKKNKKILVVDDEPDIHRDVSDELSKRGYQVYKAYNGREALDIIRKTIPDLIILDVMMPVMTGFELLKNLKKEPAYAKILTITMSVKDKAEYLEMGISLDTDFFICKPVDLKNLLDVMNFLLEAS